MGFFFFNRLHSISIWSRLLQSLSIFSLPILLPYLQSDGYIVNPLKGEQTLHQDFLMLYRIFSMVIDISNIPGIYGVDILPTPSPQNPHMTTYRYMFI